MLALGIPAHLVQWIKSFLSDRTHSVKVGSKISTSLPIRAGVPQGAVLSPMLFTLFLNGLPDSISHSKIVAFADDIKIYKQVISNSDSLNFQQDINNLMDWLSTNHLKLSANKCSIQKLGNKKVIHDDYQLQDEEITIVNLQKDLGVFVDNKLSFNQHIAKITARAASKAGRIHSSFYSRDLSFYTTMLKSYVRPILEYSTTSWNVEKINHAKSLERPQRRFSKLVTDFYDISYADRRDEIRVETLLFRRIVNDLTMVYKVFKGYYRDISPNIFFDLQKPGITRARTNMHRYYLLQPMAKKNVRLSFWSVRVIKLWNGLPDWCFDLTSVVRFKRFLNSDFSTDIYDYIKNNYPSIDF